MSRITFLYLLFITLSIAGCAKALPQREPLKTDVSPTNTPPVESEWKVTMIHSGGIMGLMRSIEVSSDGNYTVMDDRSNKTITKKLSANELSKLEEIVLSSAYVTPERSGPSGCADCFVYDLEIQSGNGKNFSIRVDDISLPKSEMEPLITYLRDLIQASLK